VTPPSRLFQNVGDRGEGAATTVIESDEESSLLLRLGFEFEGCQGLALYCAADGLDMIAELMGRKLVQRCVRARKAARVALIAAYYVVVH
jgi:hypothetical protein